MAIETEIRLNAVNRTGQAFQGVKRDLDDLGNRARNLGGAFRTALNFVGVGGGLGLAALTKSTIDYADSLNDLSQRTGVTVKDLASLKTAAEQNGTTLDNLAQGIGRLSRTIGEAEAGNKKSAAALKELGISARDPREAFFQLADAVQKIEDPNRRAALLNTVLGKSYQELLPLLSQGSAELRRSAQESQGFADAMARLAPQADQFNDQLASLKTNAAGLSGQIVGALLPSLNQYLGALREILSTGSLLDKVKFFTVGYIPPDVADKVTDYATRTTDLRAELARLEVQQRKTGKIDDALFGKDFTAEKIKAIRAQLARLVEAEAARVNAQRPRPTAANIDLPTDDSAAREAAARSKAAAQARLATAKSEAAALARAQEQLRTASLSADATALELGLDARRTALDAARREELIDEAEFIRQRTALDTEGLRNQLAALQAERVRQQALARVGTPSERTGAEAELRLVEARIASAQNKIDNLRTATASELAALNTERLTAQLEFIESLEQEAFLASLTNDQRERAILLLEAEKRGVTDINRLLELRAEIDRAAAARELAEQTQRDQDALYQNVQEGVQRAFADGLDAVARGEGGVQGALTGLVDTVRRALSNALAASLTESFLSAIGGREGVLNLAGSLGFGGGAERGNSAANPVFVRDTAAAVDSAAAPGGLFDGIFSNLFASLQAGFTSLIGGFGNLLSSLLGGLGASTGQNALGFFASLFGFAEGGYTGDGGKYQPAGIVHKGEWVHDAHATNVLGTGFLARLDAAATGRTPSLASRLSYADGGLVNPPAAAAAPAGQGVRIVNALDPDLLSEWAETPRGERVIMNVIRRNPGALR